MKLFKSAVIAGCLILASQALNAQAQMTNGPELQNDRDNKMNRMLGGDDNSFYCYRVRSKGRGTSFYVEKYNKASLKPEWSKEVNLGDEENRTKIVDVEYAAGNVYIFRRQYDKKTDKMTLFFQTVSSSGEIRKDLKEVITVTSDHYEFIDFEIFANASQTKFLIKATHKAEKKDDYKTELILMDAVSMKKLWTKKLNQNLHSGGYINYSFWSGVDVYSYGFIGMYLDENDDVYYCTTDLAPGTEAKQKQYILNFYTLKSVENSPKSVTLAFDDKYYVRDIEFSKTNDNHIVVGGFMKDVIERKGRDLVKCGIFSFKINPANNAIVGKSTKFFDDKMLAALESNAKRSRYFAYKMDYILPIGDDVYYVGEQYNEVMVVQRNSNGTTTTYWNYEYMDVIVAKLNKNGDFEWISNSPLRNEMRMNFPHVFKQYIVVATNKNLYILNDDHPKNIERYKKADFEPRDLKSVKGIHGSNFVCNTMSLKDGKITDRTVLMENEDYCFAPIQERNPQFIPPSDTEIFVKSKNNEIYIYTEDRGRDRFAKIQFQ